MNKVFNPGECRIYKNNGVSYAAVYIGGLYNLEKINLSWNIDKTNADFTKTEGKWLTLEQIAKQLEPIAEIVTVFFVTPTSTFIYQWRNNSWYMFDSNYGSSEIGGKKDV